MLFVMELVSMLLMFRQMLLQQHPYKIVIFI